MFVIAALLSASLLAPAPPGAADPPGRWPVPGAEGGPRPTVARLFRPPPEPWAAGHRGVDLRTAPGAPVRAAGAGVVTFAGRVAGRGVVTLELDAGGSPPLRLTHEPVRPAVAAGDRVRAGEVLGELAEGPYHCAEPCLHWGLLRGETYLDPLGLLPPELLRRGPSRLLPTAGVPLPEAGRAEPAGGNRGEVGERGGGGAGERGGGGAGERGGGEVHGGRGERREQGDRGARPGPGPGAHPTGGPAGPSAPAGRRDGGGAPGRPPAGAGGRHRRGLRGRGRGLSHGHRRAWPAAAGRTWCGSG
ncbi:M23 family metallopeptidase [Streptomyces hoynatensis]|uniref:M23 family metallopeptidase n=1 Tax=Streptomyces hoynatensis TaxID=1141874 RepID=UPI0019D4C224|nr:M23 family metallopeptidase [Streptomyces hoynatensis]